jgi:hypothetical protein
MTLQDAHAFIRWLREHPEDLAIGDEQTMAGVIEAARAAGYSFDETELRAAHGHDWVLRWLAARPQAGGVSAAAEPDADKRVAIPRAKAR